MDPTPERAQRDLEGLIGEGNEEAAAEFLPIVYAELHRLAEALMGRERPDHTLQPTALIHEAFLRLAGAEEAAWSDRDHFYRVAARAMRRVLVDHARRRGRSKRGGDAPRLALEEEELSIEGPGLDLLALDEALERLTRQDELLGRIVELRFFGGLKHPEIARALGASLRSVERGWALARAWLNRELSPEDPDAD